MLLHIAFGFLYDLFIYIFQQVSIALAGLPRKVAHPLFIFDNGLTLRIDFFLILSLFKFAVFNAVEGNQFGNIDTTRYSLQGNGFVTLNLFGKNNPAMKIADNKCYVTLDTANLEIINHRVRIKNNFGFLNC